MRAAQCPVPSLAAAECSSPRVACIFAPQLRPRREGCPRPQRSFPRPCLNARSAPYGSVLDYSKFSLVVHVNDTSGWVATPTHRRQAERWTSEAGPPTHTIADMSQLLPALRSISKERVREMQAALQRVRRAFLWKTVLSPEAPAAADIALRLMLPSYQMDAAALTL